MEVSVFLRDGISSSQQQHLNQLLVRMPEVARSDFESKEEAYRRFQDIFKTQKELVENVSPDALPASFRVKLEATPRNSRWWMPASRVNRGSTRSWTSGRS